MPPARAPSAASRRSRAKRRAVFLEKHGLMPPLRAAVKLLRDRDDSAAARRLELPHARVSQAESHGRAARSSCRAGS
eukprot:3239799-Prymnesium_polylepis.1